MKLRLNAAGFGTYTGQMGVIMFENGLSVGDVLPIDAVRVAGVIGAVWEDGTPANVGQRYIDNMNTPAPNSNAEKVQEQPVVQKPVVISKTFTEAQLGAIADAKGIAGIREISEPLGIKGNSIAGLIAAIMKVAGAAPEQVTPEPVAAEPTTRVVTHI